MQFVTILREYRASGACADCGRPSDLLIPAYNRFTQSKVHLCPTCSAWHGEQAGAQFIPHLGAQVPPQGYVEACKDKDHDGRGR